MSINEAVAPESKRIVAGDGIESFIRNEDSIGREVEKGTNLNLAEGKRLHTSAVANSLTA